jgi:4-amino-4-deoxy-L-arabinose transferase-like glycosyltransferase
MGHPTPHFGLEPALNGRRGETLDRLLLAGTVLLYLFLAARRLDLPVPGADEAVYVVQARDVLRAASGDGPWPLMVMTYVGCPMSYVLAPLVAAWGPGPAAMRLPAVAVALAAVLMLLFLISRIFPRVPAWIPASVCLLNSTFLISSRTGLYVDASIHWLLLSLLLASLWGWFRTRRDAFVLAAFFAAGLGLYSKIVFVWFLFPAAFVLWKGSRRSASAGRTRLAALAALGYCVGALPLLIYNVRSGWPTVRDVWDNLIQPGDPAAASNLDLAGNLATRAVHLFQLFSDSFQAPAEFAAAAAAAALLALFAAAFFLFRDEKQRPAVAAVGMFTASFIVGVTFTISGRFPEHLFPILPLMLVLAGVALARLCSGRGRALLACLLLAAVQLRHYRVYLDCARNADGALSPSALASLAAYLTSAKIARPVAIDWGIDSPLFVASAGMIEPRRIRRSAFPHELRSGDTVLCLWEPPFNDDSRRGCARVLDDPSVVVGDIRKFVDSRDAPVYAAVTVRDVR